jgi:hypothetical protein
MKVKYDTLGWGSVHGHWILKPQVQGQSWCVCAGDHPHDPDGDSTFLCKFDAEEDALNYAKDKYKEYLLKELKK